jgi:iron complex outermembrane receptor protein
MTPTFTGKAAFSRILKSGAAAIALLAPAVSFAQDAPAASTDDDIASGNAIVVTATKREQTLQEIPVAVSVTTGETLERENIRDLRDLQTVVPSLRVSQLQSSANTNFIIRGFGNGANNAGIEPSVGVFIDGVYRSRTAGQIGDLPDVSRIEVLRGPQSTLFGKNASAGVISIVTREPSFDFQGSAELSYGNYDAIVARGYLSGPISESIAVSIAGGFNTREGYNRDLGSDTTTNGRDRWFVRGQALFDNGSNLRVRLIADYDQIDENCCGVVNLQSSAATQAIRAIGGQVSDPANPFANVVYNNFPSTNYITNQGVSGQIDYEAGPLTFTSITAYRETDAKFNQDPDFSSADLLGRFQTQELETFTQEVRLTGEFGPLTALLGAFYFDESVREDQDISRGADFRNFANLSIQQASGGTQNVAILEGTLAALYGNPAFVNGLFTRGQAETGYFTLDDEALSIFGQVDFEITDDLVLTLGGNYTMDKKASVTNYQSSDLFYNVDLVNAGARAITAQGIATTVGNALRLGRQATQAEITAFASGTSPAGATGAAQFPTIQAGAAAFAALNAPLTQAAAAADSNPQTVGNPFLGLRALQLFPPFVNIPNSVESGETDDDNFSYTVRLAYDLSGEINVYGSYGTGFKASSFNLSRDGRPFAGDIPALRAAGLGQNNLTAGSRFAGPEDATVFELGVKADWGNYSANLTGFRQDIDGFQSNTFTGTGFFLANAGKQRTWGVEFEGVANPIEQLTLNLGVTWLDPSYVSYVQSPVGDISGSTAAGIPEWTVVLGGQWEQELASGDLVIARSTYHFESDVSPVEGLPGFIGLGQEAAVAAAAQFSRQVDDLSASLTYVLSDNGLEFSLWARNLLNDRYIVQIFDSPAQPLSISGYPNQPRTYGGLIRYKF